MNAILSDRDINAIALEIVNMYANGPTDQSEDINTVVYAPAANYTLWLAFEINYTRTQSISIGYPKEDDTPDAYIQIFYGDYVGNTMDSFNTDDDAYLDSVCLNDDYTEEELINLYERICFTVNNY